MSGESSQMNEKKPFKRSETGRYNIHVEDGTPEGWYPLVGRDKTLNYLTSLCLRKLDANVHDRRKITIEPV